MLLLNLLGIKIKLLMDYILTSKDDLTNIINEAVGEDPLANKLTQQQPVLLTRKEASDLLKVSPVTLWKWEKLGKLKSVRLNSRVRYRLSDIYSFLDAE